MSQPDTGGQGGPRTLQRALRFLRGLWSSGGTLSQRATRGSFWAFFAYGGVRVLSIVRSVVLARLLLPADFGLVGQAQVATGFLAIWTEIGMAPALIQKQDAADEMLDTAWMISVARGVVLAGITFLTAGWFAAFFKTPALTPILQVMALTFVGYGMSSVGLVLLKKELDFRRLAYVEIVTEVLSLAVGVVAAVILRSAWALVLATLAKVFLMSAASYVAHPYRPKLRWRGQAARELMGYGKYILGSGILGYFLSQGDSALIGRTLGTADLGLYNMGRSWATLPSTSITGVIGQVAFPAYAKLQNDRPALLRAYLSVLKITAVLAIPVLGGLCALAPEVVRVLYGPTWMPMAVPFMILCVAGLEQSLTSPIAPVFNATGRPSTVFYMVAVKVLLFAAAVFPLTGRFGIVGASIASAVVSILVFGYGMPLTARLLGCKTSSILKPLAGPFGAASVMALSLVLIKLTRWFAPSPLTLLAMVLIGALVYGVALNWLDPAAVGAVRQLLQPKTEAVEPTGQPAAGADNNAQLPG